MKERDTAFLQATVEQWEPYYPEPLTEGDARTLATNMTDFFRLLAEWDSAHRQEREQEPKDAR